jgi:hypothetical protein
LRIAGHPPSRHRATPNEVARWRFAQPGRLPAERPNVPRSSRARSGLRCLTVRVSDRTVRHLISTGYLSLESRETAAHVAFALEAWIYDNVP